MTINSRRKGARGENDACKLLAAEFGLNVKRKLGQARDSGTDILDLPGFSIEVKRRAKVAGLYDWLGQAVEVAGATAPVLMLRADGQPWLVVMGFYDWAKLARETVADELTS